MSKTSLESVGEFGLIARFRARAIVRTPEIRRAIGDDAAVLALAAGDEAVVTTDLLIEAVHFHCDWVSARDLGWKSLAVNLSDLAAMGATPLAAFIGLGLPRDLATEWVDEFYVGLEECAAEFGATIAGGDTTASPQGVTIAVTLLGKVATGKALLRSGAQAGDALVVTGTLGDSAAGLRLLQRPEVEVATDIREPLLRKHNVPVPRLREAAAAMRVATIHAAIDLSDGLAGDAGHLAEESHVGIEIEEDAIPISPECRAACKALAPDGGSCGADPIDLALRGGEDYELLLAVDSDDAARVMAAINEAGTATTVVGKVVASQQQTVVLRQPSGRVRPVAGGFQHFTG